MPSLIVGPVVEADFDRMLLYTDEAGGSLAAPIMFDSWPATEPTDTARRNAWSMEQQRWQFHNDPTVRFMKVEDQASGEIVSLARWHRYNDGYPQENTYTEVDVFAPQGTAPKFPEGFNGRIHAGVLEVACRNRAGYVKPGLCWILTTLITRSAWRKQGAGGMLVDWGAEQALKDKAPAYIEALPAAKPMYMSHGFKHVEDSHFDMRQYGEEEDFAFAIMRKDP